MEDQKRVTLTFDNGPTPDTTSDVLDGLHAADVRATFFACGSQLQRPGGRDVVRRAADEGHWIGNHTMSHPHTYAFGESIDPDLPAREIGATQDLLGELAHPDRLFRPPGSGGHLDRRLLSPAVLEYLQREAYTMVLWNSVPRDWENPDDWVESSLADIAAQSWTVVVLHDIPTGAMRHLRRLLSILSSTDVEIVQDFPESCVPLRRGVLTAPIDHLMSRPATV